MNGGMLRKSLGGGIGPGGSMERVSCTVAGDVAENARSAAPGPLEGTYEEHEAPQRLPSKLAFRDLRDTLVYLRHVVRPRIGKLTRVIGISASSIVVANDKLSSLAEQIVELRVPLPGSSIVSVGGIREQRDVRVQRREDTVGLSDQDVRVAPLLCKRAEVSLISLVF